MAIHKSTAAVYAVAGTIAVLLISFYLIAPRLEKSIVAYQANVRNRLENCETWYNAAKDSHAMGANAGVELKQTWFMLSTSESTLYLACMERNRY